ncbi:hypothetical protein OEZ86_012294 [Tetradesmus obliquus]|nr:hypothetical protein OEZ86_012294 [Tetradesmus obliquus]
MSLSWRANLCALCAVLLLATHATAGPYPAVANRPSFVAVGDGLTESAFSSEHMGWGLLLQQKYVRKADIINRGYGGFFTSWFVDFMLDSLFNVGNPALGIIFLGVKDSLTPAVSGNHYISPQQFGSNVQRIMDAGKKAGISKFLLITPPPVCEACKGKTPKPWDRENSHSVQYVQQLAQLASRNGAAFLDIFSAWQADPDWHNKLLLPDKLHLSPKGNEVLFNAIVSTLERSFPELAPSGQALNWPLMDVISKDDPKAAFSKVVMNPSRVAGSCGGGSTPQWSRGRRM